MTFSVAPDAQQSDGRRDGGPYRDTRSAATRKRGFSPAGWAVEHPARCRRLLVHRRVEGPGATGRQPPPACSCATDQGRLIRGRHGRRRVFINARPSPRRASRPTGWRNAMNRAKSSAESVLSPLTPSGARASTPRCRRRMAPCPGCQPGRLYLDHDERRPAAAQRNDRCAPGEDRSRGPPVGPRSASVAPFPSTTRPHQLSVQGAARTARPAANSAA